MGADKNFDSAAADRRLCAQCRQLDLSVAGRDLSDDRKALAERAGLLGRYTPMTDVGVRVACMGKWSRTEETRDCPLCHILIRDRAHDTSAGSFYSFEEDHDHYFYAFLGQYCFQETGMALEHNFLVVRPDLDRDEDYGMDPVPFKGRQIHGANHKLHPDFTRRNSRYIVSQATTTKPYRSFGLRPRAISGRLDISILKEWLEACQGSHGPCHGGSMSEDYPIDMRLIDCQSRIVIDAERINGIEAPSYVALSYVWGGAFHPPILPDGVLPATLPQVIEDAIEVTLATGYRYLWADQYCIDQTDTMHKAQQIKIMDRIYSGAAWTIVDGAGGDANYGLSGISSSRSEDLGPVRMKNEVEVFHWPSQSAHVLDDSKWATRAWTYQEAFFSKRIVIFTATGLYFECQTTYENEGLVRQDDLFVRENSIGNPPTSAGHLFPRYSYGPLTRSLEPWNTTHGDDIFGHETAIIDFWRRVQEYTCRQMTFPEDSLAAFRGVLQFYVHRAPTDQKYTPLASVCGIPFCIPPTIYQREISEELSLGLCWSHAHGKTSRRRPSLPSWSWAGWVGQVHGGSDEPVESLLCDISFETVNSDGTTIRNPWYEMQGHDPEIIVLEGHMLPCGALHITENGHWDAFGLGPHARFDLDEDVQDRVILQGLRDRTYIIVPVVLLGSHRAQSGSHVRRNGGSFERVGLFILGSSAISFKLINLINEGKTLWDTATLRII